MAPARKNVPWKPTREQLEAARRLRSGDVIAPNLRVLFAGINPGLYFRRGRPPLRGPGNRFWPTLHAAGFTPRVLSPFEDRELLKLGYGVTNVVPRTTAAADELDAAELIAGAKKLIAKSEPAQAACWRSWASALPRRIRTTEGDCWNAGRNNRKHSALGVQPQRAERTLSTRCVTRCLSRTAPPRRLIARLRSGSKFPLIAALLRRPPWEYSSPSRARP